MIVATRPPTDAPSWRGTSTSTPASVASLAPAWPTTTAVKKGEVRYSSALGGAFVAVNDGTTGSTGITGPAPGGIDYSDPGSSPAVTWRRVTSSRVTVQNEDAGVAVRVGNSSLTSTVGGLVASYGYGSVDVDIDDPAKVYVYSASNASICVMVKP